MRCAVTSLDYYDAEAKAAIKTAASATSDADRMTWIRIALAWHDLARDQPNARPELRPKLDAGYSISKLPRAQHDIPT